MPHYIDPRLITGEFADSLTQPLLAALLFHPYSFENAIFPSQKYHCIVDGKPFFFSVTHPIVRVRSDYKPEKRKYVILGDRRGKGAFGSVFDTEGKIVKRPQGVVKEPSHMAIKEQESKLGEDDDGNNRQGQLAHNEYVMSKDLPHLQCRPPVYSVAENGKFYYAAMNRIRGKNLSQVVEERFDNGTADADELLAWTKSALRGMQDFHRQGKCHFDVKLENMIVNGRRVFLVDSAFGKFESEALGWRMNCGSPLYLSPEWYNNQELTQETDLFSLGLSFGFMWGADQIPAQRDVDYQFVNLFENVQNFDDEEHQQQLAAVFKQMVETDPTQRGAVAHHIAEVEKIILERKLSMLPENLHESVKHAHQAGVNLREYLRGDFGIMHSISQTDCIYSLRDVLVDALVTIEDSPEAIAEFVEMLEIDAFTDLTTTADIIAVLTQICLSYQTAHHRLESLRGDKIEQQRSVDSTLAKRGRYAPGLDELVELTRKFESKHRKIQDSFKLFKSASAPNVGIVTLMEERSSYSYSDFVI